MILPYRDINPTKRYPAVTVALIAINCAVYAYLMIAGRFSEMRYHAYLAEFGLTPSRFFSFELFKLRWPVPVVMTPIAAMFLHGNILHLAGNMLYLWIFGNNIEDKLGHIRFVFFYIFCGIVSAYAHAFTNPHSLIPMIGASGAIAGILGAYLLLFPKAYVHTLIFLGFFITTVRIPALIVIGFWAIMQFASGFLSRGLNEGGGVAWFAHVGGFLIGLLTVKLWMPRRS